MCGRYYVDDETSREIEKILRNLNQNQKLEQELELKLEQKQEQKLKQKQKLKHITDIRPSDSAVVISRKNQMLVPERMNWGFPGFQGKGLLINARAEGVLDKKMFRESVLYRRCVIPAKGFYEWNRQKEKSSFETSEPILFMAGCFKQFQGQNRFVILTTEANASVQMIHERMPLILEPHEVRDWILDDGATEFLLHKTPILLKRQSDYEQMSLF